jgi:hypothetical protein
MVPPAPAPIPAVAIEARPGSALALRLRIRNRMMAAGLLRPAVDDWVANDGQILPSGARIEPGYVYLLQGAEAQQTITLLVPAHLGAGAILTSSLRFPGLGDESVPIEVRIRAPVEGAFPEPPLDVPLAIALPLAERAPAASDDFGAMAQASYSLVAGLAGLDMIPARWLVGELLAVVAKVGEGYGRTDAGRALLDRLGRTRFFKNGVVAMASAQAPRWILSGLAATSGLHAALGGQAGQGQLLYIWERWLLGLAEGDIESDGAAALVRIPDLSLPSFASEMGSNADRWFGSLVLGLAALSPRVATALEAIAAQAPDPGDAAPPPAGPPDDVIGENGSLGR